MSYYRSNSGDGGFTCLVYLVVVLVFSIPGAISVNYLLATFLDKTIPFWGAWLIGLFASEITIPVAVIVWVLSLFGVI